MNKATSIKGVKNISQPKCKSVAIMVVAPASRNKRKIEDV